MLLEAKELTVSLASGKRISEHISFQVEKGEMLSIVGSSGAGKTTICMAVMGLLGTSYKIQGKVIFHGKDILAMHEKERRRIYGKEICYIMQNPMTAFNPSIKIGRQLEKTYLQRHNHTTKAEISIILEKILQKLGLEDTERIRKSYPFMLSGGMLQRLMIAAALINQPQVLVADETTTAIDACNRLGLMEELRKLCDEGMSILFVTHDIRSTAYSDKILIMNRGKVVESGMTKNILENPKEEYTKQLLYACHLERRSLS